MCTVIWNHALLYTGSCRSCISYFYWFVSVLDMDQLPSRYSLPCGLLAGLLASTTTQPADVVKTRMQVHPESFSNITHTLIATMREGGFKSLFVGLVPRATRRTLMASFTWAFYEHVRDYCLDSVFSTSCFQTDQPVHSPKTEWTEPLYLLT